MKRKNHLLAGLALMAGLCLPAHAETFTAMGITEPINDVLVSSSVAGLVSAWKFKEGDFVKQNDVIIELDNRLEELDVERRQDAMDNAKVGLESLQTLVKQSSISVKKEELLKAETEYKIATVEWQMAVEQLRRRRIAAPCAGYIADIARDVGEACEAYQPLIRVVDTRQCNFVSNVEAKAAGRLKLDQSVKLEIETTTVPITISGKIVFLSPVVDPASGLQKVRILFDNTDGRVRPGVAGKMIFE